MYSLSEIKAMNSTAKDDPRLPLLNEDQLRVFSLAAQVRVAMGSLDEWLAHAERLLVGRTVVRTSGSDPLYGALATVTPVTVAAGASGYHMFLTAPVKHVEDEYRRTGGRVHIPYARGGHAYGAEGRLAERARYSRRLLELGVNCELIEIDDTPRED